MNQAAPSQLIILSDHDYKKYKQDKKLWVPFIEFVLHKHHFNHSGTITAVLIALILFFLSMI